MRDLTAAEAQNLIGITEKWYEYQGGIYVKRYLDKKDGTQEYWGEDLTPFKKIPFVQLKLEK